jgi:hypothetical protein
MTTGGLFLAFGGDRVVQIATCSVCQCPTTAMGPAAQVGAGAHNKTVPAANEASSLIRVGPKEISGTPDQRPGLISRLAIKLCRARG